MKKKINDLIITLLLLGTCFLLGLIMHNYSHTNTLIPLIFVLGSFLTAVFTDGYIYGILSAVLSVLAVNFAFTLPFFKVNFTIPENLMSAHVMIVVTLMTCFLTTKLKKQEAMKTESEKERMRANLMRAVSHDLRTPLTTIYGSSSALLENYGNFTENQTKQILRGICEDSQWLTRMVENLLSITRLDNSNMKIIKTETVLDELIDSILLKFAKRYPEIDVILDLPDEFITIPMDAILIEQVAINILENAVQHAKGMTELILKVYTKSNKAFFEIKDNGCGISKDRLKNIFDGYCSSEAFIPDSTKNNAGIGLSVCATIIKAHDGEISVESSKNGTLFRFVLAMEESDNE